MIKTNQRVKNGLLETLGQKIQGEPRMSWYDPNIRFPSFKWWLHHLQSLWKGHNKKIIHRGIKVNMTKLTVGRSCRCPLYYSKFSECLKCFLKSWGNTPKKYIFYKKFQVLRSKSNKKCTNAVWKIIIKAYQKAWKKC